MANEKKGIIKKKKPVVVDRKKHYNGTFSSKESETGIKEYSPEKVRRKKNMAKGFNLNAGNVLKRP